MGHFFGGRPVYRGKYHAIGTLPISKDMGGIGSKHILKSVIIVIV